MKLRNSRFIFEKSDPAHRAAIGAGLMQMTMTGRDGKRVRLEDGRIVTEFVNCSYLGLDVHPTVVDAFRGVDPQWGANFCCARSRFTVAPLRDLESELASLYGARVVTFPSLTSAHLSILPLIASGILLDPKNPPRVTFVFDRFAHASMQWLKPTLSVEAEVQTIGHNDLEALRESVLRAKATGRTVVYVADAVYSMGGICPIDELLTMSRELEFYLYLDDAHGTTVYGARGEGSVLAAAGGVPERTFVTFSLTKGFGAAGGGVIVPNAATEHVVRTYGQVCAFSAPLDFASVEACRAVVRLHEGDLIPSLQRQLRERVALFDAGMGHDLPFSPIRMVEASSEEEARSWGVALMDQGYFVSVVSFPVVPQNRPQLRVCIAANHTEAAIVGLTTSLKDLQAQSGVRLRPLVSIRSTRSPAELHALSPRFGRRIRGAQLRDFTVDGAERLRKVLYREKVIVFEEIDWSIDEYLQFARRLGKPVTFVDESYRHPEHEELFVVSNVPATSGKRKIGKDRVGYYWHSDSSFCQEPLPITALHAQLVPASGGETAFVDMQEVYRELPKALKDLIATRSAVHEAQWRYLVEPSDVGLSILEILERDRRQLPPVTHPVVLRHRATNDAALYVSEGVTRRIVGLDPAESEAILAELFQRIEASSARYVHRWSERDLVLWDNRSVVHRAFPAAGGGHRLLHRVGINDGGFFTANREPTALPAAMGH